MGLNEPDEVEVVLEKLAEALAETVVRFGSLIELTNQVREMHASGTTYSEILETADRPLITEPLTDLTEQRRAEAEIPRLNADLEARVARRTADLAQANENLTAFTYSVSHDL